MMARKAGLAIGLSTLALSVGCGGTEPMSALTTGAPALVLPLADASVAITRMEPYNQGKNGTSSDAFKIHTQNPSVNVLAPASGIVAAVDNTPGAAIVYLYHGPRLTTRVAQLQQASVLVGTVVQTGSVLGLSSSSLVIPIQFSVFYDGGLACPLSYMTAEAQTTTQVKVTTNGSTSPCL
jgi:hypothetical protein